MGKNLKGKECGKGIYQRKDGRYSARYIDKAGKRPKSISKRFRKHATGWKTQNTLTSTKKSL